MGKYYMRSLDEANFNDTQVKYSSATTRAGYDKVIRCLGFKFNFDIFNKYLNLFFLAGK